jgi:hypothetical protein
MVMESWGSGVQSKIVCSDYDDEGIYGKRGSFETMCNLRPWMDKQTEFGS